MMFWWPTLLLLIGGMVSGDDVTPRRHHQRGCENGMTRPGCLQQHSCPGDDVTDVFVVINSVGHVDDHNTVVWRRVELIWHTAQVQSSDQVTLYDHCQPQGGSEPLLTINAGDYRDHFYTTDITVGKFNFTGAPAVSACLGFCAEYRRAGATIATNCLRSQPNWMAAMAADIQGLHLHELMLPGTHDSASYTDYRGQSSDDDLAQRYASAQEESLLSQFYHGVRHFDVRVLFAPDTAERFWVSHGVVPFRPFHVATDDIVTMMQVSSEIVIFEVGGFEGAFDTHPEAYEELLDVIRPQIQRWLVPMPADEHHHILLADLWAADQRLVFSWDRDPAGREYLWPRVPSSWHDDNTPETLYATLQRAMEAAPRDQLWALSGEMTPHTEDVIFDRLESLRQMADVVNRNVSRMVRYDWWEKGSVVLADFFMGTYNVDTAQLVNWQRAHC